MQSCVLAIPKNGLCRWGGFGREGWMKLHHDGSWPRFIQNPLSQVIVSLPDVRPGEAASWPDHRYHRRVTLTDP